MGQARPAGANVGLAGAKPAGGGGGGGAAAAGLAAPAPTPPPAGAPWDAQAEREWGGGENKYRDKMAGIQGDWAYRQEWYGLGGASNPYSQAALLQHRHEVDNRTVMNSAGNQLYAGSTVDRHAAADRTFDVAYKQLEAAYAAENAKREREEAEARHEWEDEQAAIREGAVGRAEEVEPPPAPEEGGGGGGGGGGSGPGSYATVGKKGKKSKIGISSNQPAGGGKKGKGK